MRQINKVAREKEVYKLDNLEEFKKGEWLKLVPDRKYVEVSYRTNDNVIEIKSLNPDPRFKLNIKDCKKTEHHKETK